MESTTMNKYDNMNKGGNKPIQPGQPNQFPGGKDNAGKPGDLNRNNQNKNPNQNKNKNPNDRENWSDK